ncbi:MAG: radical SAM protein [Victivallales bacterium]|nr:radical SAM protein [Victivallales bacterium]
MTETSTLRVTEKFLSIQGESTHAGRLCYFIRLSGCNLRCRYCDTLYAQSFTSGSEETITSLVAGARASGVNLVEITGGEPLAQGPAAAQLCRELLAAGFEVLVETNGSADIGILPPGTIRILDCKTPSSGEAEQMNFDNYEQLTPRDEIKFVLSNRQDYDYARDIIRRYRLEEKTPHLIFSPVWPALPPRQLAAWLIADRPPVRMQLQLHKYIWGPEQQGV